MIFYLSCQTEARAETSRQNDGWGCLIKCLIQNQKHILC